MPGGSEGISRLPCPPLPGFPYQGTSRPALRLPTCLSVGLEKLVQRRNLGGDRFKDKVGKKNFFARCVCVCFHFVRWGSSSVQLSAISDAVPSAYKASFSIRKGTAVKAAEGLALQGPELGLITLLLPGMILVVSCSKENHKQPAGLGSDKERDWEGDSSSPCPPVHPGLFSWCSLRGRPGFQRAGLGPHSGRQGSSPQESGLLAPPQLMLPSREEGLCPARRGAV